MRASTGETTILPSSADEGQPGIARRKLRGRWAYFDPSGARITDPDTIDRLNRIGLPPAYSDAWFASDPDAHLLATGIDARNRKQYRYHPDFVADRDAHKFEACARFGAMLPAVRARVEKDLANRTLSCARAIASVVRLLDSGRIRIGNEAYARANRSFGATTLRRRHARIEHGKLLLRFKAKSGKACAIHVSDRGLIRFVKQVQDLPGQHLFQYADADGTFQPVGSSEVNAYIREVMGEDFTAKHFRTWRASALAFEWLASASEGGLREMLAFVSAELCNTPAIARKSYVHPALVALAKEGSSAFRETLRLPRKTRWLSPHERGLIAFLAERA
jgi:DNA topoisomerase-1